MAIRSQRDPIDGGAWFMNGVIIQRAATFGLALASVFALGACDNGNNNNGGALHPGIAKFQGAGPERVTQQRVGICTRFLPPQGAADSRVGLGWANGTGGTPGTYSGILTRVASYGSLVSAANTTNSGTGRETAQCITELNNARSDANGRFAASGHSQGGSGCINATRLNNLVQTTCPVQLDGRFTATSNPADIRGSTTAPALIMCGGLDTLAPCGPANNGDTKFAQARVPVTRISVNGASHFVPTGGGGIYAALVTTCVEALAGDADASAALRPGGQGNTGGLSRVDRRNF
jgi:pimeloyl-ACP methyl ester carboxylesterase